MLAVGCHRRDLRIFGRREVGQVGVPLRQKLPRTAAFGEVHDFANRATRIDSLDVAQLVQVRELP